MARSLLSRIVSLCALIVLLAVPTSADWLVTKDGARIETKGAWEVRKGLVVFTAANGTLSSMRLTEVDLDASAEATTAAKNPPPPPPEEKVEEKREPVLVLTNEDLGPRSAGGSAGDASASSTGSADGGDGEGEAAAARSSGSQSSSARRNASSKEDPASKLRVVRWESENSPVGKAVVVTGVVRNDSEVGFRNISLNVNFTDEEGGMTYSTAQMRATMLPSSKATTFRAILRDVEKSEGSISFNVVGDPQNPAKEP